MQVGDIIDGKYELVRLLGEGGMGSVYEARHIRIGRRAALKFLHPELNQNAEVVTRFMMEAQAAAAVGSEHIVDVFDVGETADGAPYLVMEFLEGTDLSALIKKVGPLPPLRATKLVVQACRALVAAHGKNIVHRDLKPENLFLYNREDGAEWVKVLDFGIAKFHSLADAKIGLTTTGTLLGTPYYMAPEQATGAKNVDHRVDIYSMGVILYELITGRPPYVADSYNQLIVMIATMEPPAPVDLRPDLSLELDAVIRKAMARNVQERFSTMEELAQALHPFVQGQLPTTRPEGALNASLSDAGSMRAQPIAKTRVSPPADEETSQVGPWSSVASSKAALPPVTATPFAWQQESQSARSEPADTLPEQRRRSWVPIVVGLTISVVVVSAITGVVLSYVFREPQSPPLAIPTVQPPPGGDASPAKTSDAPVVESLAAVVPQAHRDGGGATDGLSQSSVITLKVRVVPERAQLKVDGIVVTGNPYIGRFPRDGAQHKIEVSAPRYEQQSQFVTFDSNQDLTITLDRASKRTAPRDPPVYRPPSGSNIVRDNPYQSM